MSDEQAPLSAQIVCTRFCDLQTKVSEFLGYDEAADCFCGEGGYWKLHKQGEYGGTYAEGYRNAGRSLLFIEKAVCDALAKAQDPTEETE